PWSLPWWSTGIRLKGSVLASMGVQAPNLLPERLVLLRAVRVDPLADLR
ncbi:MAG: hypothetical protein H7270_16140, partial [Dermatophilaceae bacterium]|nr:hypothetical protein [Dermatophilaceae bacterium]